ncbi:unnamed protein product [Schistosoma margrebowiei]|uniref:Uncharacterized protein n=1 Tax=Schistosoma margrebowiei TaxID=48269 RepID=A0A183LN96_9TREM|nr:unnamed protein product [Schistosoma margrebowiei]
MELHNDIRLFEGVFGTGLIVMGSYVHLFLSTFLRNMPVHMLSLTFIMMALGCLLFSLGSIGILFVLTGRRRINALMGMMFRDIIKDSINQYTRKNSYAAFVNTIQLQHKCCGANSVMDYTVNNLSIPVSCYPDKAIIPHKNYAILLSVMVAAEIAAGITAAVLKDEVKSQFLSLVKSSVNEYSKNPDFKDFLDKIQQEVYH